MGPLTPPYRPYLLIAVFLMILVAPLTALAGEPPAPAPVVDLSITKASSVAQATVGDTVTWTIQVGNAGTAEVPLANIRVDDPGVVLTPVGSPPAGRVLRPGERLTFTGSTVVAASSCPALVNTAQVTIVPLDVTAAGWEPPPQPTTPTKPKPKSPPKTPPPAVPVDVNPANNSATVQLPVTCPPAPQPVQLQVPAAPPPVVVTATPPAPPSEEICPVPAMRIGIVAPRKARPGRRVRVALTIRNNSPAVAASALVARYTLPRGAALARVPKGARMSRGQLVMRMRGLAPQTKRTVWLTLRVPRTFSGRQRHRASVTERCSRARAANTITRVQRQRPSPRRPSVTG